ncbi:hypothetical protein SUGI_0960140 [Cryptomeria japonica]|nr:hypothetical protein SUGI_0960140 [Cryptomeria japonica]
MNFYEGEPKFRHEIVRTIPLLLAQKYHITAMQGEARMCQEVANFFRNVRPNGKGVRIAGLHRMPGLGKTTLGKAFCNFNYGYFDGKVYHLEFVSGDHSMDRENFKSLIKSLQGQRALLVLDNIPTKESIDVVNDFLQADWGVDSWILLSARSVDDLQNFNVQSYMRVPGLEKSEAIAILLESTSLAESALAAENRGLGLQCANICSFKETSAHTFHLLTLKTFGRHLFSKYSSDLAKWVPELDGLIGDPMLV